MTDEELVPLAVAGDEAAFTRLYERHRGLVEGQVRKVLRGDAEAAYAVETLLRERR